MMQFKTRGFQWTEKMVLTSSMDSVSRSLENTFSVITKEDTTNRPLEISIHSVYVHCVHCVLCVRYVFLLSTFLN